MFFFKTVYYAVQSQYRTTNIGNLKSGLYPGEKIAQACVRSNCSSFHSQMILYQSFCYLAGAQLAYTKFTSEDEKSGKKNSSYSYEKQNLDNPHNFETISIQITAQSCIKRVNPSKWDFMYPNSLFSERVTYTLGF